MKKKPIIAVTMGDPSGIGPEVIMKSLASPEIRNLCRPVVIGTFSVFARMKDHLGSPVRLEPGSLSEDGGVEADTILVLECPAGFDEPIHFGQAAPATGEAAATAIRMAVDLAMHKRVDAMVTGPVSKQALRQAGYRFAGQTEFLAELTASPEVIMMLTSPHLKVALVTTHCRLAEVAGLITTQRIIRRLSILHSWLPAWFGIDAPRIAVLSLNPHAGEGGLFGPEESETIEPAVARARDMGIQAFGPLPADAALARWPTDPYDAYLAMYHDQGLVAVKMDAAGKGVNITLGLPIIRTSPDHGTAFDIAGKGLADPGSMTEAIRLAASVAMKKDGAELHHKEK
jgi:4-hydroxythreonine-4-phosphate dehydrogenase